MRRALRLILSLSLSAFILGCGGGDADGSKRAAGGDERVVARERYGLSVDGYQLKASSVQMGETMTDIMLSNGCTAADVSRLDRASRDLFPLRNMRVGDKYTLFFGTDSLSRKVLSYIAYERDPQRYVLFAIRPSEVEVTLGEKPAKILVQRRVIRIESSLWSAMKEQQIPMKVGDELEHIFQWSLDLFDIQNGDTFTVLYEEQFVDDSVSLGMRRMVGAKFQDGKRSLYAIAFGRDEGRTEYWDELGNSCRMQLMASPLSYSKISSRRQHYPSVSYKSGNGEVLGVNYEAPTGSPVYSVGDGVVKKLSRSGDDGNAIVISHDNHIESGYHHLSRFARGVDVGRSVDQGQLIGYVGMSGDSQTPHLDYRLWVDGVVVDPSTVTLKPVSTIDEGSRGEFKRLCDEVVSKLDRVNQ